METEDFKTLELYRKVFSEEFIKQLFELQQFVEEREKSYDCIQEAHKKFMDIIVSKEMKKDVVLLGLVSCLMRMVRGSYDALDQMKKDMPPVVN